MSDTFKHKAKGKYREGLVEKDDMPFSVRLQWWRENWDIGEMRARVKRKREKQVDKDMVKEIEEW